MQKHILARLFIAFKMLKNGWKLVSCSAPTVVPFYLVFHVTRAFWQCIGCYLPELKASQPHQSMKSPSKASTGFPMGGAPSSSIRPSRGPSM